MNLSGKAVKYWMDNQKIKLDNILVISDDLNLKFNQIRLRKKEVVVGIMDWKIYPKFLDLKITQD